MITLNLNKHTLLVEKFDFGKTTIVVKIGRKKFYLDIDKNRIGYTLTLYNLVNKDRTKFSKYDEKANAVMMTFNEYRLFDRNFFENMEQIQKSEQLLNKFGFRIEK